MHLTVRAAAALKRLDTMAAAALIGASVAPAASAWLCADSTCSSAIDTATFYTLAVAATAAAGLLLWFRTRRWWVRAVVLLGALYASTVAPAMLLRHGRWTVPMDDGTSCVVRAAVPRSAIHRSCGIPSRSCEGPKYADLSNLWNPVSIRMCGFTADVYGNRVVTYGCTGCVSSVTTSAPQRTFPPGCWSWSAPGGP